ncbi:dienelactone hydrolase family protein [Patescibacteria group bacterium]|nr:dienelactone hydrolase family protein [Patescibacteria group bacterium]
MTEREIEIPANGKTTKGILSVPDEAKGLVLFAHGSGSSRLSPRNTIVARELQQAGLATLLMDLLTPEEEADRVNVFDIDLLAKRLQDTTSWLDQSAEIKDLTIGYFGASTGAAAALQAAAGLGEKIKAVVSRGGRPDLAMDYLPDVKAPTLLIVGGDDEPVIGMNQEALTALRCEKKIEIVPGATHLFEEPGKLEEVARLATGWFTKYLK